MMKQANDQTRRPSLRMNNRHIDQLTLPFDPKSHFRFEQFNAAGNEACIAQLEHQLQSSEHQIIFLSGLSGTGKTHLLQASCFQAQKNGLSSRYHSLSKPLNLNQFDQLEWLALDDLTYMEGQTEQEAALFHLFNRCQQQPTRILIASSKTVKQSQVVLPDLQSRLSWGLQLRLQELNEVEKHKTLIQFSEHWKMNLDERVFNYLLKNQKRDMKTLTDVLKKLAAASLREKRKPSLPLLQEILRQESS